jgi:hypothetical protein
VSKKGTRDHPVAPRYPRAERICRARHRIHPARVPGPCHHLCGVSSRPTYYNQLRPLLAPARNASSRRTLRRRHCATGFPRTTSFVSLDMSFGRQRQRRGAAHTANLGSIEPRNANKQVLEFAPDPRHPRREPPAEQFSGPRGRRRCPCSLAAHLSGRAATYLNKTIDKKHCKASSHKKGQRSRRARSLSQLCRAGSVYRSRSAKGVVLGSVGVGAARGGVIAGHWQLFVACRKGDSKLCKSTRPDGVHRFLTAGRQCRQYESRRREADALRSPARTALNKA